MVQSKVHGSKVIASIKIIVKVHGYDVKKYKKKSLFHASA